MRPSPKLLVAGLLITGCAASHSALNPGAPSEWVEVHTEHFRVRAQLDERADYLARLQTYETRCTRSTPVALQR